jgi:hypothetical protein
MVNDEGPYINDSIIGCCDNFNKIWIGILGDGYAVVTFMTWGTIIDFIGTINGLTKQSTTQSFSQSPRSI